MKPSTFPRVALALLGLLTLLTSAGYASTLIYATTINPFGQGAPPGILKIDEDGSYAMWSIDWDDDAIAFQNPQGIAIGPGGNVFVNDGRYIYKITPSGQGSIFAVKPFDGNGLGLAVDSSGNVYATGRGDDIYTIYKFASSGEVLHVQTVIASSLEIGPDGFLYALESEIHSVWQYDADWNRMGYVGQTNLFDFQFSSDGYMYMTNQNRQVYRLSPDGTFLNVFYSSTNLRGTAIVLDEQDNIYVANRMTNGDHEIRKITPTQIGSTFTDLTPELRINYMTVVPEPGTCVLLGMGIAGIGFRRRR